MTTEKRTATRAFSQNAIAAKKLLGLLTEHICETDALDADWGHVGTVAHMRDQLMDLAKMICSARTRRRLRRGSSGSLKGCDSIRLRAKRAYHSGALNAVRIGRRWKILPEDRDAWLATLRQNNTPFLNS